MKIAKITQKLSFAPIKIEMLASNGLVLAVGTAFVYKHEEKAYLITNWHNVTGREPSDLSPKHKSGALPVQLALYIPYEEKIATGSGLRWRRKGLNLYDDKDEVAPSKASWLEHPNHQKNVDVVAIQIEWEEPSATIPANDMSLDLDKLCISVGMDVVVLGFPRGMTGGGKFPIWKRGTIASEPDIDIDGFPQFFIDTATKAGMSGAPVYGQSTGFWPIDGGKFPEDGMFGLSHRFLGVYSGRIKGGEFEAQLGRVWKEEAIIEIINGDVAGKSAFDYVTIFPQPAA